MKKIISVLVVLCLAMTIFAAGSVRVGGAFNFMTGKSAEFDADSEVFEKVKVGYKTNGFGFDVAGDFDVASNLSVWADFDMVFCSDFKFKAGDSAEVSFNDLYDAMKAEYDAAKLAGATGDLKKAINIISIGTGVAYKLDLNAVEARLGGGLFFERALALAKLDLKYNDEEYKETMKFKASNFGIALYGDVKYKFNDQFGLGLTVMPHVGLINTFTVEYKVDATGETPVDQKDSKTGFRLSFSMPIVVGVSYSF